MEAVKPNNINNQEIELKCLILLVMKKYIPKTKTFLILLFILKILPIISISHGVDSSKEIYNISTLINLISLFSFDKITETSTPGFNYSAICFLLYLIILLPIILIIKVYRNKKKNGVIKNVKLTKNEKYCIKFSHFKQQQQKEEIPHKLVKRSILSYPKTTTTTTKP